MINFISLHWGTYLLTALILCALIVVSVAKFTNWKVSYLTTLIICLALGGWVYHIKKTKFYLESPSQNNPAYILKTEKGEDFAFFASRYFRLFEGYEYGKSHLTLRLLNPKMCLVIKWVLPASEAERVKAEVFGNKIIFPFNPKEELCAGRPRKNFYFEENSFNHKFEMLSKSSARHLYFLDNLL